jgi:hypothetical protein
VGACVITATLSLFPTADRLSVSGNTVIVSTAGWVTVTACPATVTTADRAVALVLAAAVSVTLPDPVPLAGLTVTQG